MERPENQAPASGPTIPSVSERRTGRRAPRRRSRTRLAQLRIEHGFGQDELAALLGISVPRYSGIENATLEVPWRWPTVEQAQALAEHFDTDVSLLWPFLTIGPCPSTKHRCSELTFNGRECRKRLGPEALLCHGCGEPLGYRRPARIGERNWHRDCYLNAPRERKGITVLCPICEEPIYRKPSRVAKYSHAACCSSHWARYRWQKFIGVVPFIKAHERPGHGHWPGPTRRLLHLRAAPRPGRPRLEERLDFQETIEKIRARYEETHASERDLARETGESRTMVRLALGRSLGGSRTL
jgi:transcriptional regulator with XRE-family HTH domain